MYPHSIVCIVVSMYLIVDFVYCRMSYEDFVYNFDECQLCHLQPDGVAKELALEMVRTFSMGLGDGSSVLK